MIEGSCLCKAVRFAIDGKTTEIGMCHCSKCRKVSGTASNAELMAPRDALTWTAGEDRILRFALEDGWGVWRCERCGSPLPKLHPGGGAYWVPAGVLDGDPGVRVAGHIFVGSKAPWDEIAGDAPRHHAGFDSEPVG
jgi:hypothetical protein